MPLQQMFAANASPSMTAESHDAGPGSVEVQRQAESLPTVSREAADAAEQPVATPADPSVVQRATAPGPAPAAAGAGPTDVEELARRLFDPLAARLKAELWLDRERAGLVTDLRR